MDVDLKEYLDGRFDEFEKLITAKLETITQTRPTRKELIAGVVAAVGLACTIMGIVISIIT